jgi:hypothetical protein
MNKLFRTSIATIALVLPVLLASCGSSSAPSERILQGSSVKTDTALFVAKVTDSSSYIVIMRQDRNMAAYTYDNAKTTTWFTGTMQDDHFLGTAKNGSNMAAIIKNETISGKLDIPNQPSLNFTALSAEKLEADVLQAVSEGLIKSLSSSEELQTYNLHMEVTEEIPDQIEPNQSDSAPSSMPSSDQIKTCLALANKNHAINIDGIREDSRVWGVVLSTIRWLWGTLGCNRFGTIHFPHFPRP